MDLTDIKKAAIFGDLHCGVHSDSTMWHTISKDWAIWFKNELTSRNINTVFFLGDYFHDRSGVSLSTLQVAADILSLWKEFNIIFVIGNHDCQNKFNTEINSVSILQGWNNIHVVNSAETLDIGGKKCSFVSWGCDFSKLPVADYMFGHFEINGFKMNNYKVCEKGVTSKDLLEKAPIVFSGHFHHRDEREYSNNQKIIYAGNPFEMDFGDLNNTKGVYILDFNSNQIEFVQNKLSPTHIKIKVSEYTDDINANKCIVRLIVDKKLQVDEVDVLVANLSKKEPLQLSVEYLYNNTAEVNIDNCDLSGIDRGKAIEEFINLLDIDNKQQLNDICQEIYASI